MLSTDAKDTVAFLWCLDKAILSVTHCNNSPGSLNGALALTNTKPCLKRQQCRMLLFICSIHMKYNANNFSMWTTRKKPPSKGSEVEKYWVWKYCMSCSHRKNVTGKPCWQPSWNGAYMSGHSPSSSRKHQKTSLNTCNADSLCHKTAWVTLRD